MSRCPVCHDRWTGRGVCPDCELHRPYTCKTHIRMRIARDLYYQGEVVEVDAETAEKWVREGYAERGG